MWSQKQISLPSHIRGFHIITHFIEESIEDINKIDIGLLHVFIHHTSASLTINEDADPSVRQDFETHFNELVPEDNPKLTHTLEGSDDMPAHLKSAILGSSLTIPIQNGKLLLGTWQGIYLCEHRDNGGSRKLTLTLQGE
tara:strand:+ start:286 stop:705 length:420 start_codon:yes stop_codon:yes gene_type:complete